jgi:plastocyanin
VIPPRRILFPMAAVLGAGAVVLPAAAGSEASPTIDAVNEGGGIYGVSHRWSPAAATVGENGVVSFSNPTNVPHGIEWRSGPGTPTCSSGVPVGDSPSASGTQWSGTCTFARQGTYTFYCTVHGSEMTGTVDVSADGTTTTSMNMSPGGTTTTSSTSTTSASPTTGEGSVTPGSLAPAAQAPQSPVLSIPPARLLLAGSASSAVKVPSNQGGGAVRGSVDVGSAGSGGRLEVRLLAVRGSLASAVRTPQVQVGRLVRPSLHGGAVAFTVRLDAKAQRALRAHHRLALDVKVVLSTAQGAAVTVTRSVLLRS